MGRKDKRLMETAESENNIFLFYNVFHHCILKITG